MGDTGDAGCFLQDQFRQEHFGDPTPSFSTGYPDPSQPSSGSKAGEVPQAGNPPFLSQYSSIPPAQQMPQDPRSGNQHGTRSFNYNLNHDPSLNMASMVEALPEYSTNSSHQGMQQRHSQVGQPALSGASTSALVYQLQQISQYPGQTGPAYPNQLGINTAYQASPYQNMYSQRSAGPSPTQQSYPPISPQNQQYFYYPNQYGQTTASPQFMGHPGQMNSPYDRSFGAAQVPTVGQQHSYMLQQQARVTPAGGIGSLGSQFGAAGSSGPSQQISDPSLPLAVPRGPPRKPKQSGHALWVGNLPPGTTVLDLKDHFSRDATEDIESLFLISKSNCAFVNYRTETSCIAAMHRFHESRFNGVRLVCRLRRTTAPASGVPTGPAAMTGATSGVAASPPQAFTDEVDDCDEAEVEQILADSGKPEGGPTTKVPEKFFVVKSLTLQDLETSVRNGIWATQAHNEDVLNKAFEAADNVYLIFSANKSGEYFGYARMTSPISGDASQYIGSIPQSDDHDSSTVPKSIPTPATAHAPKGHVIDDSARGTIFWEADRSDDEGDAHEPDVEEVDGDQATKPGSSSSSKESPQDWGKPFKLEWISTQRLPFYRTRGLRNPWNANREVKIARDGTELEPNVGRRLIQMFQRMGPSPQGTSQMPGGTQPPMRPY